VTGPEHYREAERLLAEARKAIAPKRSAYPLQPGQPTSAELYERNIAEAQVNATLALAAATAVGGLDPDSRAWADVAGNQVQQRIDPCEARSPAGRASVCP
jgi:hypothetical protein